MSPTPKTIDRLSLLLCKSVKHVLESSTKKAIQYSTTIQQIPKITMKPEVGCFVQFTGDYSGLVVLNLSAEAAVEIYRSYMLTMGMPEDELAKDFTSSDVADTIGEITNQIMGLFMRTVEDKYNLSSFCGQPKALALNNAITLTIDADYINNRRVVFKLGGDKFHMELAMEQTEFIPMK